MSTGARTRARAAPTLLLVAFLVALGIRLLVVAAIHDDYEPQNDALDFHRMAVSLADEGQFPEPLFGIAGATAFRAPAYPLVLAAGYLVGGDDFTTGLVQNAVIGAVAALLVGLVALRVWGRRVGVAAAFLAAVHPTMVIFGTSLQLEPLLITCVLGSLLCALSYRDSGSARWVVGAGLLFGLAILTREVAWPLVIVDLVIMSRHPARVERRSGLGEPVRRAALFLVAGFVVVAPWTIRNLQQLDSFVPVSTSPEFALAGTYNEQSVDASDAPWLFFNPQVVSTIEDHLADGEDGIGDELNDVTVDVVKGHPTYPLKVMFWNTVRLFDGRGFSDALETGAATPYPRTLIKLSVLGSYGVELLALLALAIGAHRAMPKVVWLLPFAAAVTTVLVFGMMRYRASVEPFSVMLAAVALVALWDRRPAGASTTA